MNKYQNSNIKPKYYKGSDGQDLFYRFKNGLMHEEKLQKVIRETFKKLFISRQLCLLFLWDRLALVANKYIKRIYPSCRFESFLSLIYDE